MFLWNMIGVGGTFPLNTSKAPISSAELETERGQTERGRDTGGERGKKHGEESDTDDTRAEKLREVPVSVLA